MPISVWFDDWQLELKVVFHIIKNYFFTKQSDVDKFVNSSDIHTNEVISVSSNAKVVLVFVFA